MYVDVFNKTQNIVKFLFADSKKYRENVYIGILDSNNVMKELRYDISNLDKLNELKYSKSCNYYITANTIKNNRARKKDELFSLHNICIDIDLHNSSDDILRVADSLKYFLIEDTCERIPIPSVFVLTGRGVQLWWHFEECSSKLLFMYQALLQLFITELNRTISAVETLLNLKVDIVASQNIVGYFRLPFTFNTKADMFSFAVMLNEGTYNLCDLFDEYCEKDAFTEKSKKVPTVQFYEHEQDKSYTSLIMKRKQFIEQYCLNRNYHLTGSRDLVMFLYCVCLFQVMHSDFIMLSMKKLNEKFTEQLPQSQLDYIFKYMSKKKVLRFKQETFLSFLPELTDAERQQFSSAGSSNFTRDAKRKLFKEQRNEKIASLFKDNLTYEQIAVQVNCTSRTVKNVLKSLNLSRK